eukprot:GHVH01010880.1.p1 GENE.GHVH01010880.1~~GHVH01010880.1.p1  ORF type:complete len:338 (+),score=52.27 GHVH01010880.1:51-1016(+)
MDAQSTEFFNGLRALDPTCSTCFDCGRSQATWASVSHGVLICLLCSGNHRGFGVHVSFVKSLTMDSWSDAQMQKMKAGGNAKAKAFFTKVGIMGMDPKQRYFSNGAKWYRSTLSARAENLPEPVQYFADGEGCGLVEEDIPKATKSASMARGLEDETIGASPFSLLSGIVPDDILKTASVAVKSAADQIRVSSAAIAQKAQESNMMEDLVSSAGQAAEVVTETVSTGVSSAVNAVSDPNLIGNVENTVSKGWNMLSSFTSIAATTMSDVMEKGTEADAVKGTHTKLNSFLSTMTSGAESFLGGNVGGAAPSAVSTPAAPKE